jgi:vacuolar-type H+-ATPase subunit I/STV1
VTFLQAPNGLPIEPWVVFLIFGVVCLLIGIGRSMHASNARSVSPSHQQEQGEFSVARRTEDLQIWDEDSVARHLAELRGQSPAVVAHYLDSVKTRWVLNQNDKTAAMRARFLKTKVEELNLFKQGQQIMVDLEALALEREKRLKTLQLENAQLDETIRTRSEREKLVALKEQRQLELDIARIEAEISALKNPPPEARPSPEQQRRLKRVEIEDKLAELDRLEAAACTKARDEEERLRLQNMYADRREELREQLARYLV